MTLFDKNSAILSFSVLTIVILSSLLIFNKNSLDDISNTKVSSVEFDSAIIAEQSQLLAELRSDLSLLNKQVALLQKIQKKNDNVAHDSQLSVSNVQENDTQVDKYFERREEAQVGQRVIQESYYENLENSIINEFQDPIWSSEAEASIYTAMEDGTLTGSQLVNVSCKSTLCKAEVQHESMEVSEKFGLEFHYRVSSMLPKTSIQHTDLGDGRIKTTLYLVKKGYDLPTQSHQ